jgi:hypothetical protein
MDKDKPLDPIDAGVFGADAAVQPTDTGEHLVKKHRLGCCARGVTTGDLGRFTTFDMTENLRLTSSHQIFMAHHEV